MIGESPTRPGILNARPLVVVVHEISPAAFIAAQWMVPVGRQNSRRVTPANRLSTL